MDCAIREKSKNILGAAVAVAGLLWLGVACAGDHPFDDMEYPPAVAAEATAVEPDDALSNPDPFEGFNRAVFTFNTTLDNAIFRPVARGYRRIMPDPLEKGVSNFFSNLDDVGSAVNNLLQGRINNMFSDISRVLINSTVGVLGFIDVASKHNIPKRGEDLGQTFGVWGIGTGPYVMLPFIGPSSARDAVGWATDFYFDPLYYIEDDGTRWGMYGFRYLDRRAAFLTATDIAEQAALDPYIFYRESYFQQRAAAVRDARTDDF